MGLKDGQHSWTKMRRRHFWKRKEEGVEHRPEDRKALSMFKKKQIV